MFPRAPSKPSMSQSNVLSCSLPFGELKPDLLPLWDDSLEVGPRRNEPCRKMWPFEHGFSSSKLKSSPPGFG